MINKLTLLDIKQAMKDKAFRDSLPAEFECDIAQYLKNPGYPCNNRIFVRVSQESRQQLQQYYPDKEIIVVE